MSALGIVLTAALGFLTLGLGLCLPSPLVPSGTADLAPGKGHQDARPVIHVPHSPATVEPVAAAGTKKETTQ